MKENSHRNLHVGVTRDHLDLIFSPCEVTDPRIYTPAIEKLALRRYEELYNDFYKDGVTFIRQCIIKRVSQEWQVALRMNFQETYRIVNSVSGTLLLNEIELIYWSTLFRYKTEGIDPLLFAYFSGYFTKACLNNEVFPFEVYLNTCIPSFKLNFYNWQIVSDFPTEINVQTLQRRYKELNDPTGKELKDYDYMVDQLMQMPRRKESIMSESCFSEAMPDDFNGPSIDEFNDLLQEAKHSPIDKIED